MIYRNHGSTQRYLEIRFFAHRNGLRGGLQQRQSQDPRPIPFESGNQPSDRVYVKNLPMPVDAEGVVRMARIVDDQHDRTVGILVGDIFNGPAILESIRWAPGTTNLDD